MNICIYVYICMYIHICIRMYTYIYVCIYIYIFTHICIHIYKHIYIYTHVNIHIHIYTHIFICTSLPAKCRSRHPPHIRHSRSAGEHTYTYTYIYTYIYTYTYTCISYVTDSHLMRMSHCSALCHDLFKCVVVSCNHHRDLILGTIIHILHSKSTRVRHQQAAPNRHVFIYIYIDICTHMYIHIHVSVFARMHI